MRSGSQTDRFKRLRESRKPTVRDGRFASTAAIIEKVGKRALAGQAEEHPHRLMTEKAPLPRYPEDAPRDARVIQSSRGVCALARNGVYLGFFRTSEGD